MGEPKKSANVYRAILELIFFDRRFGAFKPGDTVVAFDREDIPKAARLLKLSVPKNLGDVVYSFRMRAGRPGRILDTQRDGLEWQIRGVGDARYEFRLGPPMQIVPRPDLATIDIPDATPEIIRAYAQSDEQALLAVVRYNRLIDIFLGLTTYSLQNHLRSKVAGLGQLEIDEIYVGIDKRGTHYVIPVQAKGGSDKLTGLQSLQDYAWCIENLPGATCRPVSCQFMSEGRIALFELVVKEDQVKVLDERHYKLVSLPEATPRQSKRRP